MEQRTLFFCVFRVFRGNDDHAFVMCLARFVNRATP